MRETEKHRGGNIAQCILALKSHSSRKGAGRFVLCKRVHIYTHTDLAQNKVSLFESLQVSLENLLFLGYLQI